MLIEDSKNATPPLQRMWTLFVRQCQVQSWATWGHFDRVYILYQCNTITSYDHDNPLHKPHFNSKKAQPNCKCLWSKKLKAQCIHNIIFLVSISTITFKSGKWCQTFKLIDMKMWGFVDSCTKVIGWWSRFLMFVCMYSHIYKYGRKTCLAWLLTFCTYCSVSWNLFHQKSHECSEIFLKNRVF